MLIMIMFTALQLRNRTVKFLRVLTCQDFSSTANTNLNRIDLNRAVIISFKVHESK